jgi:glutamate-1-semialdehyde 2,1-aminomutase
VPDETLGNVTVIRQNDPDALEQVLSERDVAAVIIEPTGAGWGTVPLDPSMLPVLREATKRIGAILIFDEVVTGFRVAPGGVQAATGITPDLTTLAKVLAGGLPGGAVVGNEEIMSLIEFRERGRGDFDGRIPHPGTFNANPLSAAAGNAALRIVATGEPQQAASGMTHRIVAGLNEVIRKEGASGCAYAEASMFHIILGATCPKPIDDFSWDWQGRPTTRMPHMSGGAFWSLRRGMLNEGIDLMGSGGLVSAAHAAADADRTVEAFESTVRQLQREGMI